MFSFTASTDVSSDEYYQELVSQLTGLLSEERDLICNAAQLSAFIMQMVPDLNWSGFYFAREEELVLGPYVGKVACTRIPFGRGVCGKAAETLETQRIEDVHAFEGHIACDADSASEVVIPVLVEGRLIGVFDMDSPNVNRFTEKDQKGLEALVNVFVKATDFAWHF